MIFIIIILENYWQHNCLTKLLFKLHFKIVFCTVKYIWHSKSTEPKAKLCRRKESSYFWLLRGLKFSRYIVLLSQLQFRYWNRKKNFSYSSSSIQFYHFCQLAVNMTESNNPIWKMFSLSLELQMMPMLCKATRSVFRCLET